MSVGKCFVFGVKPSFVRQLNPTATIEWTDVVDHLSFPLTFFYYFILILFFFWILFFCLWEYSINNFQYRILLDNSSFGFNFSDFFLRRIRLSLLLLLGVDDCHVINFYISSSIEWYKHIWLLFVESGREREREREREKNTSISSL